MSVFVLDKEGLALMPCTEKRARLLLQRKRARVHRLTPFVIRLVDRQVADCSFQPLRVKIDPGSNHTGLALVRDAEQTDTATGAVKSGVVVLNLFELVHRGRQISEALTSRRAMRRRRRGNLRHRAPRFRNRTRSKGRLAPSLQHRVITTLAWVKRLQRWTPVAELSVELVRFDMRALPDPDIEGAQYQQGTPAGYEVREYLLEKWGRKCAYCEAAGVPLQIEHIHPKARGGSNRISNLTLACQKCNTAKGALPVEFFVTNKPRLLRILSQLKRPLKDAAAVNSTRNALVTALQATGLPVETASGGRTKYNRTQLGVPKTHALDAVCVGALNFVEDWNRPTLVIKCTGRGSYQRTRLNKYGFPSGLLMRIKRIKGFATGDLVRAEVPSGKNAGVHVGRAAIRATGKFNIQTDKDVAQGVSYRYCTLLQRADGYGYTQQQSKKRKEAGQESLYLPGINAKVSHATG